MKYTDALATLSSLGAELPKGHTTVTGVRKFSLDHIRALSQALGNPQNRFPSVLIAGTNGKGSTASTLASIAAAAGIRCGLYTSPHLERINERIRVSQPRETGSSLEEIPDAIFGSLVERVNSAARLLVEQSVLPHPPSFFEAMTAVAFCYFADEGVELAILEVGLGGRLDATNAVEPIISVITDIGFDHMEYLGDTIAKIAAEKAGILRQDGVLVTLSQHQEANYAIGEIAVALNVRGVDAARCLPGTRLVAPDPASERQLARLDSPLGRNRYDLSLDGEILHIDSPLSGPHQQRNIALAIATAVELRTNHGFAISNEAMEQGVRDTVWPGRLEWLPPRLAPDGRVHAPLLLDVAHNPAGAWTLRSALSLLPPTMPRTLVFSCLAEKPVDEMMQVLLPLFDSSSGDPDRAGDHVVLAPIQSPRAASLEELEAAARKLDVPFHAAPHVPAALAQAEAVTPSEGIIVVTGSIFLVGEARTVALAERKPQAVPAIGKKL
ncbi:dihydrofolate synthase / folylpolyglutamate synthase [Bryocella elongata]|uniref:Dihydrofolate synthase / folylpolyglutamate synthase n=1 Tax=Bryocella elongata TaxID=863522 RepID=A0A1H5Y1Y9_9BACT|nr:folylpolyglutamate synthase/dihydrofolate synthase family protein [Bryocella elongata]SEG17943.1 dihydrofolate synthase / folylpolyglutamate synthase [Bryocella elongata]